MSRKCVFQKEFLVGLYAKCRELIQKCCMKFIQTWQRFSNGFPCFCFVFVFQNKFRFTSYKYVTFGYPKVHRPTYLIVISIADLAPQTTNSNMVWYLNMNKSTYSHWSKHVGGNLPSAMHFIIFVTFRFFFSEIARLCSFIIDTFLFCK